MNILPLTAIKAMAIPIAAVGIVASAADAITDTAAPMQHSPLEIKLVSCTYVVPNFPTRVTAECPPLGSIDLPEVSRVPPIATQIPPSVRNPDILIDIIHIVRGIR